MRLDGSRALRALPNHPGANRHLNRAVDEEAIEAGTAIANESGEVTKVTIAPDMESSPKILDP
jgi:hypothetical protein